MSRKPNAKQVKPAVKKVAPVLSLDLKEIEAKTDNQERALTYYDQNRNLIMYGQAGTGKTYLACFMALNDLLYTDGRYKKVVIVRSIVSTRDMGFMPGNLTEKSSYYEAPYYGIFADLFGRGDAYEILKSRGMVEFTTTSFLRGNTFDNCILIFDEAQNTTDHECNTLITRMGENSKIIICGDSKQCDLNTRKSEESGFMKLVTIARKMNRFNTVEFTIDDIVRSAFIKEYLIQRNIYETGISRGNYGVIEG